MGQDFNLQSDNQMSTYRPTTASQPSMDGSIPTEVYVFVLSCSQNVQQNLGDVSFVVVFLPPCAKKCLPFSESLLIIDCIPLGHLFFTFLQEMITVPSTDQVQQVGIMAPSTLEFMQVMGTTVSPQLPWQGSMLLIIGQPVHLVM